MCRKNDPEVKINTIEVSKEEIGHQEPKKGLLKQCNKM